MKPSRTAATVVLAAFLSSTLPHVAAAQDDPVTTQARARFKEGVDFYDKGQFENARLAFLQAYALKKHPAVLLNLAQSSAKSGHPLEASKYFQQFVKESTGATPAQRTDAEAGLSEVRQKLGRIEIVAPAGTDITLDEKERLGTAPFSDPIDVEPGSHSLRAANETVRVTANAGQKVQAKFGGSVGPAVTPVPVGPPVENQPAPPPPQTPAEPKGQLPMWPAYVGAGVAGVTLATTIIFAISKSNAQSKANSVAANIRTAAGPNATGICTSTASADVTRFGPACQTLQDDNDKVNTDAALANVSGVLLAVSGVFAVSWFIAVPIINKKRASEEGSPPPAAVGFFHDVSLTPYAGLNNGGMTLRGGF